MEIGELGINHVNVAAKLDEHDVRIIGHLLFQASEVELSAEDSERLNVLREQFEDLSETVGHAPTAPTGRIYREAGTGIMQMEGASEQSKQWLREVEERRRKRMLMDDSGERESARRQATANLLSMSPAQRMRRRPGRRIAIRPSDSEG